MPRRNSQKGDGAYASARARCPREHQYRTILRPVKL